MGDYRDKSGSERVDAPEKIDLTNVMLDVYSVYFARISSTSS